MKMRRRCTVAVENQMFGFYLIPKHLRKLTPDINDQLYQAFSELELQCELNREKIVTMQDEGRLQETISLDDKHLYPNVFIISQQLLTLTVTSVCCGELLFEFEASENLGMISNG